MPCRSGFLGLPLISMKGESAGWKKKNFKISLCITHRDENNEGERKVGCAV
jgi:hypothetical protein